MKTSEFIKRVEELGYETEKNKWYVNIRNKHSTVAFVSATRVNTIDTLYQDDDVSNDLFNLIVEYAKTPLEDREEREEPKRYYLRPKGMKLIRTNFVFNYYVNDGEWSLYGKDETRLAKTRFTLKELEDLGINTKHYDLEEVE